ncbi:hypothetical protein [Altericista sp. CCNU0014]|uniref:hypothetical protein n=1 Tax=Altericista sp. CCNU0014 TaxID=3082949 RepID=UPI00384FCBB9
MTKVNPPSPDRADEPNDRDANLVAFLRQHAPPVPEVVAGAEDRLMAAIAVRQAAAAGNAAAPAPAARATRSGWPRRLAVAAGFSVVLCALWQLYRVEIAPHRPVGDLAEIENFWFQNWDEVANAEDVPLWLAERDSDLDSTTGPSPSASSPSLFYRSPSRQE